MSLVSLLLVLVVVGFICWLITLIPMPPPFPKVITGVIILFLVLWLLQQFGVVHTNLRLR